VHVSEMRHVRTDLDNFVQIHEIACISTGPVASGVVDVRTPDWRMIHCGRRWRTVPAVGASLRVPRADRHPQWSTHSRQSIAMLAARAAASSCAAKWSRR
jgi:hypothetical protein